MYYSRCPELRRSIGDILYGQIEAFKAKALKNPVTFSTKRGGPYLPDDEWLNFGGFRVSYQVGCLYDDPDSLPDPVQKLMIRDMDNRKLTLGEMNLIMRCFGMGDMDDGQVRHVYCMGNFMLDNSVSVVLQGLDGDLVKSPGPYTFPL